MSHGPVSFRPSNPVQSKLGIDRTFTHHDRFIPLIRSVSGPSPIVTSVYKEGPRANPAGQEQGLPLKAQVASLSRDASDQRASKLVSGLINFRALHRSH